MSNFSLNNTLSFDNPSLRTVESNPTTDPQSTLPDEVLDALDAIQNLNLKIEICGTWVWIFDANESHEERLRAADFRWSYKRRCWYFSPTPRKRYFHRKPWEMEKIREQYGSHVLAQ